MITINLINEHQTVIPPLSPFEKMIHTLQKTEHHIISLIVLSSEEIQALNHQYRNKNKPTNVLSFPFQAPPHIPSEMYEDLGDIFICPKIIQTEADEQKKSFSDHFYHICLHGLLHLLKYDHMEEEEAAIMENLEIKLLKTIHINNPYDHTTNTNSNSKGRNIIMGNDNNANGGQHNLHHSLSWLEKITKNFTLPASEADLLSLINAMHKRNTIDDDLKTMLIGVLNLANLHVRDIMIPRTQMVMVEQTLSCDELSKFVANSEHTRLPIYNHEKDEVIGILHAKDLLQLHYDKGNTSLTDIMRDVTFIPDSKRLDQLLQDFRNSQSHMAIVVDEYGAISGLITIEDILEEIVGDIEDEFDRKINHIAQDPKDPNSFIVNAITELDDFNDYFDTTYDHNDIDTIGGLVMQYLEHVPEEGEFITLDGLCLTVFKADKRRILQLKVTRDNTDV